MSTTPIRLQRLRNFAGRLLPHTLFARTFLLVALLISVTVASWLFLFALAESEPRGRQLAQLTASAVNLTRAALVAAEPQKRQSLLLELALREGVRVYATEPEDEIRPLPETPLFQRMREGVLEQLGANTRLASAVNEVQGLWVSFSLEDDEFGEDEYWLMLPGEHATRRYPWHWLGWGLASLALALLVAWLIVSRVAEPLRALAKAAGEVGRGRHPAPLVERGSIEMQQLADAFNRMSDDLRQHEAERAEVLAGISHDLRTPLARLRLEAELSIADEAAREAVNGDIEQMDAIIAQFLDYARGEAGEVPQHGDINRIVEAALHSFGRSLPQPQPTLHPLPPTLFYPKALARALGNLLENARKYGASEEGGLEVETFARGNEIHIDVRDRGPGIPENERERLKRPFTRLEGARSNATGTGLGLAIVERIARLHGGRLELLSREGGGLIARLNLPVRPA